MSLLVAQLMLSTIQVNNKNKIILCVWSFFYALGMASGGQAYAWRGLGKKKNSLARAVNFVDECVDKLKKGSLLIL